MGPRFVRLAALFYGLLAVGAATFGAFRGRNVFALGDRPLWDLALGVVVACGTVALGVALYRLVPALRSLSKELGPRMVDGATRGDLVLVSVFSGVGEEALFRGALQPEIGLVAASILFGVAHIGPDRRFLVWTLWAIGAGFLFGALYDWTGGLLAPTVAHAAHNAATLLLWKRTRGDD